MRLAGDLKLHTCSHSISISTGWCWVQHSLAAQSCVFQGIAKAFWMGQVITESDSLGRHRIFSACLSNHYKLVIKTTTDGSVMG